MKDVEGLAKKIIKEINEHYGNTCWSVQESVATKIINNHLGNTPNWSKADEVIAWLRSNEYITKRDGDTLKYDMHFAQLVASLVDKLTWKEVKKDMLKDLKEFLED